MRQPQNILNVSNTLTNFLKIENHFKKAGVTFLVKSAKIENAIFCNKTAPSEANVKTNGIGNAKCPVTNLFFENFV